MLAREKRLREERIQQQSVPYISPRNGAPHMAVHLQQYYSNTESLRMQRWPRGELPLDDPSAADTLAPATLPRRPASAAAFRVPAAKLYPRKLPLAVYTKDLGGHCKGQQNKSHWQGFGRPR